MTPREFVEAFRNAVAEYGWAQRLSPGQVVDRYKHVIELVEAGYDDNIYELHEDFAVRGLIEWLLHNELLLRFEEFGWVREQVSELDNRLRSVLQPDPVAPDIQRPWWEAHAPRYGGADLAADIKDRYGVVIEVR